MNKPANGLIPVKEFIDEAINRGIYLGKGNPNERLRYYIKTGLLPHQVRLQPQKGVDYTIGHLPRYALDILAKIEDLKAQKKPIEEIKEIVASDQITLEAQRVNHGVTVLNHNALRSSFALSTAAFLTLAVAVFYTPLGFNMKAKIDGYLSSLLPKSAVENLTTQGDILGRIASPQLASNLSAQISENMVINSSFEGGNLNSEPKFWSYAGTATVGNTFVSLESVHTGTQAVKISDQFASNSNIINPGLAQSGITTINGRDYVLSVFIRTRNLKGSPRLRLGFMGTIDSGDPNKNASDFSSYSADIYEDLPLENKDDWIRYSFNYQNAALGKYPFIQVMDYQGGDIFLDDASLNETRLNEDLASQGETLQGYDLQLPPYFRANLRIGDNSIIADASGNLYPASGGNGSFGIASTPFESLYLKNAAIDKSGNASFSGKLDVTGTTTFTGNIKFSGTMETGLTPATNNAYDLGTSGFRWRNLFLSNNATIGGSVTIGGSTSFADGSVSEPSITFTNDTDTGLYRAGANILAITTGGTERWRINASGHLLTGTDNSYDIGASGATRPRTGYFGTSVVIGDTVTIDATTITGSTTLTVNSTGANALTLDSTTTGTVNLGTGNSAKTVNVGTGTGGNIINLAGTGATGADTINIGTGGTGADTITIGSSASTTSLAFTSGTGSQTFTSNVATGTTTTSGFVFDATAISSGTGLYLITDSVTTGRLLDIATSGNTWTGNGTTNGLVNLASTSTAGTVSDSSILFNLARSGANANASHTAYGLYSSVTNTGTTNTNVGGYFSATGAVTNRGLEVAAMTGATSTGLTVGALSGTTANTGLSIGAISGALGTGAGITVGNISTTGTTNYGVQLGTMTGGTTSNYQISTGILTSATTTTNAQINLGGVVTTGGTTNYGINVGALSGTGTTNYGINVNTLTSVGTTNYGLNIGGATGAATTNYGLYIGAVSGSTTNYSVYTNGGTVYHAPTQTVASAASATLDAFNIPASTITVSGSTNITTATGFNLVNIGQPTLSNASVVTTNAATLYIANAPTASGGGSITNAYSLWVDAGNVRFDGTANTVGTITSGTWNGTDIALADGGTNASLTASNGGIFYSTATAGAILAGTATAGQLLLSGATAAPTWSTTTYPATNAVSTLLYASSANVMAALATANSGVLVTSGTGVPSISTDIPTAVTIGTAYIYRVGGTDVAVADGGTNCSVASITCFNNITGYTAAGATGTTSTNLVFSTSPALTTPTVVTSIVGGVSFDAFNTVSTTLNIGGAATTALNIGNGSGTITNIGNAGGATAFNVTTGTGAQTFTSNVVTGTTTTSGFVFDATAITSGTGIYAVSDSITTGKLVDIATSGNTWTGNGTTNGLVNLASTSTAGTASSSDILLNIARSGANAQLAHTAYGIYSAVTNTNVTSGTNVAGYFSATGATTANYGLIVDAGVTRLDGFLDMGLWADSTQAAVSAQGWAQNIGADTQNFSNASSTVAIGATTALGIATLTGNNATLTFTDAATLYIAGIPVASTNTAITNTALALWVDAGAARFDGQIQGTGTAVSTPAYSFVGDTDTGIYQAAAGEIKIGIDGVLRYTFTPSRIYFDGTGSSSDNNPKFEMSSLTNTGVTDEKNTMLIRGDTQTITSGFTNQRFNKFNTPAVTAASALTVTNAATVSILSPPNEAGSAVITNAMGLWIGNDGGNGSNNSYGLYVDSPTGGTNKYAAVFAGTGNVGIGTTAPTSLLHVDPAATTTTQALFAKAFVDNTNAITTNTGNTDVFGLQIDEPNITVGTATPTNSASLYISGAATEATNNYALWVDAGTTRLDGFLDMGLWADSTQAAVSAQGWAQNIGADTQNFSNASSTVAIGATTALGIATLTGNNATLTFTDAATLYIAGIPVASTNTAITNTALALWVDAGNVRFDGTANTVGTITSGTWNGTDIAVADGGTNCSVASITCFNNITGYTAAGATGTTSTNLVFSTSPALTTPTVVTSIVGGVSFDAFNTVSTTLNIGGAATTALNIGNGSGTITNIGNAGGATAFNVTTGTGAQTFTSNVATGTTTTSGFVFDATAITSGTGTYLITDSVTTGKLLDIATSGNTWTGNGTTNGLVNLASTSTAGTASSSDILLNIARSGANAQLAHTAYGIYSAVTNTNATSGTNVAGYFSASGATTANYALIVPSSGGSVGIGDATPDALLDLDSTDTDGGDFLITNTGIGLSGTVAGITSNSTTTGDLFTISGTGLTTGTALTLSGPSSTGVTDHFAKFTADIGSASSLIYGAPDFSGSAVTGYGLNITATDATANANTDYAGYYSLALSGNAAKTGYGQYSTVTTSSTTADTLYSGYLATSATGIIGSGTRTNTALYLAPASTSANTGGIQNLYGIYSAPSGTLAAGSTENIYGGYFGGTATVASGTINRYGVYVDNATMNTTGTATQYGVYLGSLSGADNNYGLFFNNAPAQGSIVTASNTNLSIIPGGTGAVQITSAVTTGTGTSSAFSLAANSVTTGAALQVDTDALTTGQAFAFEQDNRDMLALTDKDLTIGGHTDLTTQANITNTFVYDTSKDTDGGNWVDDGKSRGSSWYNETIDNTAPACTVDTDDRCGQRAFPKKALLVATTTKLYIYDAKDNTLWMDFRKGATTTEQMIGPTTNSTGSSVFALNGKVYYGNIGSVGGLYSIDFKNDSAQKFNATDDYLGNLPISSRNSTITWNPGPSGPLVNTVIYDIYSAYINGKTYTAVGTDSCASVIQENDNRVLDYTGCSVNNAVWIDKKGSLWTFSSSGSKLIKRRTIHNDTTDKSILNYHTQWVATTGPAIWSSAPTFNTAPDALWVTDGTSTVDNGESPTVYIAHSAGLTVINTNEHDETNSSVKYYTNTYITEEQVGNIRTMVPMIETASLTTSGTDIADRSYQANRLMTNAITTNSIVSVSGVRGTGLTLDGTDDYLCSDTNDDGSNVCDDNNDFDTTSALTYDPTDNFSIGIWFKHNTIATTEDYLVTKGDGTVQGYKVWMDASGDMCFGIDDDTAWTPDDQACTSAIDYDDNNWHHVVAVKQGTTSIKLYVDGVLVASDTAISATSTLANGGALNVGADSTPAAGTVWAGSVDELMITGEALNASQVRQMYSVGLSALQNHSSTDDRDDDGTSSDADTLQNIFGSTNNVSSVAVDQGRSYIYLGTRESSDGANDGGVSVIGVHSDSRAKTYSINGAQADDDGTVFANDDIMSLSLTGNISPDSTCTTSNCNSRQLGGNLIIGTDGDFWAESKDTSFQDFIANSFNPFGENLTQTNMTVTGVFEAKSASNLSLNNQSTALGTVIRLNPNMNPGLGNSPNEVSQVSYAPALSSTASNAIDVTQGNRTLLALSDRDLTLGGRARRTTLADNGGYTPVNQIFVYDTTKDPDGGKWTDDDRAKSSGWYNVIANNSYPHGFPKVAIIVAAGTQGAFTWQIYDARDFSLWKTFGQFGSSGINSTYAYNGKIYGVGVMGGGFGITVHDFIRDKSYQWGGQGCGAGSLCEFSASGKVGEAAPVSIVVNAVTNLSSSTDTRNSIQAQIVNGKTYFVAATDSEILLVNETDQVARLYSDVTNDDYNNAWLDKEGNLWALNETQGQLELWKKVVNDSASETNGTPDKVWDELSTPALANTAPTIQVSPQNLYVTDGTSTVDGKSQTVYVGTNQGVAVINTNRSDESNSSVKYITKDWISEEMVGDIRGMWHLTDNAASATVDDVTLKANDLTLYADSDGTPSTTANTDTVDITAVRGKGVDLNGSTNFLYKTDNDFDFTSGNFTISMWVNPDSFATNSRTLLTFGDNGTVGTGYDLELTRTADTTATVTFKTYQAGPASQSTTSTASTITTTDGYGGWYHIAVVRSGTSARIYVNGHDDTASAGTHTDPVTAAGSNLVIGAKQNGASQWYDGQIDELMITAEALNPSQIQQLTQNGLHAYRNHEGVDTDGDGATDSDTVQQLYGTTNTVRAVTVDLSNSYLYVAANDGAGSGGISVIGINSDTREQVYSNDNATTNKEDDTSSDVFTNDNWISVSVAGNIRPDVQRPGSKLGGTIAMANANEYYMQSLDVSLQDFFANTYNPFGETLIQNNLNVNYAFSVGTQWLPANATSGIRSTEKIFNPIFRVDGIGDVILGANNNAANGVANANKSVRLTFNSYDNSTIPLLETASLWYDSVNNDIRSSAAITTTAQTYDVAEDFSAKDTSIEAGDVVAVDKEASASAYIAKSDKPYQNDVIGIVSTNPGFRLSQEDGVLENPTKVALAGRVPVKVSTENGPIERGDYLTSSSTPGVAMKATRPGAVVGKALEEFKCPERPEGVEGPPSTNAQGDTFCTGKILAFVNVSYAFPNDALASSTVSILDETGTSAISFSNERGKLIIKNAAGTPTIALDPSTGSGFFSGTLAAKVIRAERIEGLEIYTNRIANLEARVNEATTSSSSTEATSSAELLLSRLEQLNSKLVTEASSSSEMKLDNLTAVLSLRSTGETFLGKTNIAGTLTVGTMFFDDVEQSISTLGTLKLQNSPLAAAVDFFNGQIKLSKEGNIEIEGTLIAKKIQTEELTIAQQILGEATSSAEASSSATLASRSIGESVIKAGTTFVTIQTNKVKSTSKIFVTPTTLTSQSLVVTAKVAGTSFTVSLNQSQSQDVSFDWWIVNTEPISLTN